MPISNWSTVSADNDDADLSSGINLAEGQAPGSLNDSMRALMAVVKGDFANSIAASGYQKLPGGLIVQWGSTVNTLTVGGTGAVTFPIAFPTTCFTVLVSNGDTQTSGATSQAFGVYAKNLLGFNPSVFPSPGAVAVRVNWIAVGN